MIDGDENTSTAVRLIRDLKAQHLAFRTNQ
jgi:hypothetical protein